MNLKAEFLENQKTKVEEIEMVLKEYLPEEEGHQKIIMEAMGYSLLAGGKRLRPMLMKEVWQLFSEGKESPEEKKALHAFMAAQEMIHTYSLVHDDLPAMDNDLYRRGKKTTHALYGEAMAILAGDGLLNYAFETACRAFSLDDQEDPARIGGALAILAGKAGIYGMIGGQAVDVEAEKRKLRLDGEKLLFIHEHKTAALIQSAMMIGAYLAGAGETFVEKMERAGYAIGVAFQIQDDILDVTGTLEELGKPVGSDERNDKLTYVSVYGLERAKRDVERLSEEALGILKSGTERNGFLEELVASLITRRK